MLCPFKDNGEPCRNEQRMVTFSGTPKPAGACEFHMLALEKQMRDAQRQRRLARGRAKTKRKQQRRLAQNK